MITPNRRSPPFAVEQKPGMDGTGPKTYRAKKTGASGGMLAVGEKDSGPRCSVGGGKPGLLPLVS